MLTPTLKDEEGSMASKRSQLYAFVLPCVVLSMGILSVTADADPAIRQFEKRHPQSFPIMNWQSWSDGSFTKSVEQWFDDRFVLRTEGLDLQREFNRLKGFGRTGDRVIAFDGQAFMDDRENPSDVQISDSREADFVGEDAGLAKAIKAYQPVVPLKSNHGQPTTAGGQQEDTQPRALSYGRPSLTARGMDTKRSAEQASEQRTQSKKQPAEWNSSAAEKQSRFGAGPEKGSPQKQISAPKKWADGQRFAHIGKSRDAALRRF